jgi:hypothetical protein
VPSRATHEYGVEKHQDKSKCKQQPKIGTCGHAAAHSTGAHRDDHVPSAKACQVPRRAKCQGARPTDTQGRAGQARRAREQRAHTTRGRDAQGDFTGARSRRSRAKCQGVPSARACQVPRRQADQPPRRGATRRHQRRTHSHSTNARGLTTARTHVPSAKACQVPGRAKCQGVVQEGAKAPPRACNGRVGKGWVWAADAGGRERQRASDPVRPPGAAATGRPPLPWLVPGNPKRENSYSDR